jgi:uncharacterized alpha-E superfamily protein/hemerythrin-like domain-containing protein
MLLSSMAEAMYWCGRYVARAQALGRVVSSYERLRLDLPAGRPLDLKPLMTLTGEQKTPEHRDGQLHALVFDAQNPSSVLGALAAARENLRNARGSAPPELWLVINRAYARLDGAREGSEASVLEALEQTLVAAERFDGERAGSMMRDAAYAFLTIGGYIERADMLLRSLGVLMPVLRPQGWERAFDDVRWTGLLNALGVTSSYRRRYHARADDQALLSLLLVDRDCPRSLAFCLQEITAQLNILPRAGRLRSAVSVAERDGIALCRAPGGRMTADWKVTLESLEQLHEAVQVTYFPEAHGALEPAEVLKAASLPPAPGDPFAYLGREHARAETILSALEELSGRAARGERVEQAELAATVALLTDFGELSHHEKEESILTPELVACGFGWYDGPLALMRRDHQQENYLIRTLGHFASLRDAWSPETTHRFVDTAREFCRFMRAHMDHEQHELFEQASRVLSPEAKARLTRAFIAFDTERQARS